MSRPVAIATCGKVRAVFQCIPNNDSSRTIAAHREDKQSRIDLLTLPEPFATFATSCDSSMKRRNLRRKKRRVLSRTVAIVFRLCNYPSNSATGFRLNCSDMLWEQEVARSNRVAPICKDPENTAFSGSFLFPAWWFSFAGAQSQSAATRGLCKTWMQPTWCLWERASHSVCGTDPNPSGCPLRAGSVADMKALVFRSRPRGFGIKQRT